MINFKDLSTTEGLILLCRDHGAPEAWDEFFRRYTGCIKNAIIRRLYPSGLMKQVFVEDGIVKLKDDDIVCDIYSEIYIKLRLEKGLKELRDLSAPEAFLKRMAVNKTIDWLRSYFADKNMPKADAEKNVIHVDMPNRENEESDFHEINDLGNLENPDRLAAARRIHEEVKRVEKRMEKLPEKQLWIMRLKLFYYDPLTEDEIEDLSRFTGKPVHELASEISDLVESLLKKNAEKERELSSASRVLATLNHLESRLKTIGENREIPGKEVMKLEARIQKKRERLADLAKKGNQLIDATEERVANILGIENKKNVSLDIFRVRKKLVKN